MLTARQEKFVQELVKGASQREAYRAAFDTKAADRSVDVKACRLFKQDNVQLRYNELRDKAAAKGEKDAVEMRAFILDKLQKIASGEICDETTCYDADGNVTSKKRTVRAADVKGATEKLAEFYGVSIAKPEEIKIIIEGADGYDE